MARVRKVERLTNTEQVSLLRDLAYALVQSKSLDEAALFLQDLLTKSELTVLAKRLRIAKLLLKGDSYEEIEGKVKVSHGTIAKIAAWLTERGEGFRNIISRLPKETQSSTFKEFTEWDRFKRRYSIYFWPELLLEEIIRSANKRQKDRLINVLDSLEEKSELNKRIEKLLKSSTT
jgi:uncharacterized protein YerC